MSGRIVSAERQAAIAAANALIVGAVYPNQQPFPCPTGLEETQGLHPKQMPPYVNISNGAPREWRNDEDGWQTVRRHKKRRVHRKD